ncbi:MAG TPA: signal peptidase I, partial [Acidimicrobiia bacterium]
MDLTHLDDATPPIPDTAMRSRVVTSALRRRRVRVALESAAALAVVVAVLSSLVVARGGHSSVRVATKPGPTQSTDPETFNVPSASMAPTLEADEHISVDTSWQNQPVRRGDIIVFQAPPSEASKNVKDLVKRVIGLPGDRLSVRDKHVYIVPAGASTGHELDEPYVKSTPDCPAGTQSPIAGRTLQPVTVPAGEYFVMGDNRCASEDSRAFGPIQRSSILGLAFVHVNAPTTTTSPAPNTVVVQLELGDTSVAQGAVLTGTLVFDNPTGHVVTVPATDHNSAIGLLEQQLSTTNHEIQKADIALAACGRDRDCELRNLATLRILNDSAEDLRKELNRGGCLHQYQVVIDTKEPTDLSWYTVCKAFGDQPSVAGSAHDVLESRFLAIPTGVTLLRVSIVATAPFDNGQLPPLPKGRAYVYFV